MGSWTNSDGLRVNFGITEVTTSVADNFGEYSYDGPLHLTSFMIDGVDIPLAETILSDTVTIPNGAHIEKVEIYVITAMDSSGEAATLDVGLIDQDRTTEIDYNGLIVDETEAHMATTGTLLTFVNATTEAGALVGTTLSNTGLITVSANTELFTSGRIQVRIYWFKP
jgi:hypothetical protein